MQPIVLGIDFGATKITVGAFRNGQVEIVTNIDGGRNMSTCLAFTPSHRLFGYSAECQATSNPNNTIFGRGKRNFFLHS